MTVPIQYKKDFDAISCCTQPIQEKIEIRYALNAKTHIIQTSKTHEYMSWHTLA